MSKHFESSSDLAPEIEQVRDPHLVKLWKKYGFMGQPPFKDSLAEKRLLEACEKYSSIVLSRGTTKPTYKRLANPTTPTEKYRAGMATDESDSYFKAPQENNPTGEFSAYDSEQRDLHNQITLMVLGKQRSDVNDKVGEAVGDFAFLFSRGSTRAEAFDKNTE